MLQTSLVYIEQDGCYLMLHRVKKEHDLNRDKWIGVGGKFAEGESPEECALRETKEETGLTLDALHYRGLVTFVQTEPFFAEQMHLFTADRFHGHLTDCDEGNLEWLEKERLFSLPLWEGDRIFLTLLEQNAPFFSLKLTYAGDSLQAAALNGSPLSLPF